ncbi:MAG TPA: protease inhibitor I42 family protein [Acidimicrobiia bacterium]|nr:protease inhibitor I42 family protein [Acidimicrobiia bacterium]
MFRARRIVGPLMLVLLGACSTARTLNLDDDGMRIDLKEGEEVELVLPGNPTTGYTWVVTEAPSILEQVAETEFVAESDLIGAGGEFHFRFRAIGPGTAPLVLVYERPFEEVEPLDAFEVEVTVG